MKPQNLSLPAFRQLGAKLAKQYQTRPVIIGLIGSLGAGKTTFVQAFAKALGIKKTKSPSFVVIHQYATRTLPVYHLDFYRLSTNKQLGALGLEEILNGQNIVLIEWVDKFPKLMKACNILIQIQVNPNQTRHVSIIRN